MSTVREIPLRKGDPARVTEIDRTDFMARYFRYRAGDHVTVLAPTDCGKTHLTFELLERAHDQTGIAPIFFATKPRDDLVEARGEELGYRRIETWPPPVTKQLSKPNGWLVWPPHTCDPDHDDELHHDVFKAAMVLPFKEGAQKNKRKRRSNIEVWDEAGTLAKYLGLMREQQTILKRGRSCKCGGWSQDQRAAWLPMETYNCAEHLFLHRDPVKDNRARYDDIGGFDAGLVGEILQTLPKWHYLYLRQSDQVMCVVGP